MLERMSRGLQRRQLLEQVVSLDVRDLGLEPQLGRQRPQLGRQSGRVQTAGVGDDLDSFVECQAQHVFHLLEKGGGVAAIGILLAELPEDHHRQLGQVVAGQEIDLAPFEHLARGGQAVAIEARTIGDTKNFAIGWHENSFLCDEGDERSGGSRGQFARLLLDHRQDGAGFDMTLERDTNLGHFAGYRCSDRM